MNKGCPYCVWSWEENCEVCKLTNKPTGDAVMCDFGFDEECEEYKKSPRTKRARSKNKKN